MSITVNLSYTGKNGNALKFVREMEESGLADEIRQEPGNERYDYYQSLKDPETVLLIDQWKDQQALDTHHALPVMKKLAALRDKYDLHMKAERFIDDPNGFSDHDSSFIRK